MYYNYNCNNIIANNTLFILFNIRNTTEFIKQTSKISNPKFYAYVFKNPNNQYMGFLSLMGSDAGEIMEMLNGDAVETAAERLGIKFTNVADIFQIVLGNKYTEFKKSSDILNFIKRVEIDSNKRLDMGLNSIKNDTYKKSDLLNKRPILFNYPGVDTLIQDVKSEYTLIHKTSGIAITRVKDNIKNGECPICVTDLNDEDEDILILKCCGIIVCSDCCFSTIFNNNKNSCSNCRSILQINDLIYLNNTFNLDNITKEKINDDKPISNITPEPEIKKKRTKITAMLEIINNKPPPEQIRVDVNIVNLMKGTCVLPNANIRKTLIFASYAETLDKIKNALDDEKIQYWKLGGTSSQITKMVLDFTNYTKKCVLIVNSTKHCAGLNLQIATDIIFAHKLLDQGMETQVIGRGQRLGRKSQLRVHYMFYQNEYDYMRRNNAIRQINDN
jgi:hypothetical protein